MHGQATGRLLLRHLKVQWLAAVGALGLTFQQLLFLKHGSGAYIPTEETLETQRKQKFDYSPLISIAVPAYQTPVEFLRQMIESLIVQTYSNWELCIVNASPDNEEMQKVLAEYSAGDSRVRFCNLKENFGIAENTNRAFAMTKGEFVGLLEQAEVTELIVEDGTIKGVKTYSGATYYAKAVVLCTGTYLKARCIYGDVSNYTGPNGHLPNTNQHMRNSMEMP